MVPTLALASAFSLLTGLLYGYVGWRLQARQVSDDARLAHRMFVMWWHALAATSLSTVAVNALYLAGRLEVWAYQAITHAAILTLLTGLLGLLYYLVYLYTGSRRSLAPLAVLYAALYAWILALLYQVGAPTALADNGWTVVRSPRLAFDPVVSILFALLLIGPQVGAAIAYAGLYRKAQDRTQRYRIALVAGSIIVWFGGSLVASAFQAGTGTQQSAAWQLGSRVLTVLGAMAILLAYRPPKAWRRRWGLRSIDEERKPARNMG